MEYTTRWKTPEKVPLCEDIPRSSTTNASAHDDDARTLSHHTEPDDVELWILKELMDGTVTYGPVHQKHLVRLKEMALIKLCPRTETAILAWLTPAGVAYVSSREDMAW